MSKEKKGIADQLRNRGADRPIKGSNLSAGGELLDQVVKDCNEGKMKESHAKVQYFQIVHALAFLHTRRICHRDLKLENILLAQPGPTSRIIISDFGLSKKWSSVNPLKTFVG